MRDAIARECDAIKAMLIAKNEAYGNSVLEPVRMFSKAAATEGIRVRIDDKLSRVARSGVDIEDSVLDLIGYLILLRVVERMQRSAGEDIVAEQVALGMRVLYIYERKTVAGRILPEGIPRKRVATEASPADGVTATWLNALIANAPSTLEHDVIVVDAPSDLSDWVHPNIKLIIV